MGPIASTFHSLRAAGRLGLVPFIPAGYPDLATTGALLPALEQGGASVIEVGIPFSDPIADGPTIQAAFTTALAGGLKLADVFKTIAAARPRVRCPISAMVSFSIIFRYGTARFMADAKSAGFDGLILPDLPPPEAAGACEAAWAAGLETTLLVAPTTPRARRKQIAELCTGFVYYLSVSGITGERDRLPPGIEENVRDLRGLTDRPVCVGFGVSRPAHLAELAPFADGAIVGSAIVKRISAALPGSPEAVADSARRYCEELLSQVR